MEYGNLIIPVMGALAALAAAYHQINKLKKEFKKEMNKDTSATIELMKKTSENDLNFLKMRVEELDKDIKQLEKNMDKEMDHLKEVYSNELKGLSVKVDELRDEIRTSHSSLISLLTKMIDK